MSSLAGVTLHLVDSVEKAAEFMTWLSERRPDDIIAVDTETGERRGRPLKDAFSPWQGRLRLVQVGDGMTGWAIPWERWNGVFHEAMEKYQGEMICHNIAFEARWFAVHSEFEFPWHRAHDTMIAAQIINPLESAALKSLTSKYVDSRAAGMQRMLDEAMSKHGFTWGTVPITLKEYWSYGALDCILTVRLWELLKKQVGPGMPYSIVYDLEMGTRRICTKMELNGARIDLDYADRKYNELHEYAEKVKAWGREVYDNKSLSSNRDLIRIFQDQYGCKITERTPSGQPKMDKDQLKRFTISEAGTTAGELAAIVLKMRKASKLAETYFLNFTNNAVDGLVHPNVRTMGARTGRMSITDPALQTLNKGEKTVRAAFIPRDPENEVLMNCDLDQVEFRMTAGLSKDPGLIELFNRCDRDGGDAFTEIMREVYSDSSLQKSDSRRKLIKGVVYGKLYGAGVAKMALTAGVAESQMRSVVNAFDSQYPGVKQFSAKIEDEGMRRLRAEGEGYVTTATGRRLPADSSRMYSLTNYAIQGGAAEVFKLCILKCDAAGLSDYLVVPVHDELVLSVPKDIAGDVAVVLQESMTTREGWAVPLTAGDPAWGENWGELID
jgi:DNA polymerase-1